MKLFLLTAVMTENRLFDCSLDDAKKYVMAYPDNGNDREGGRARRAAVKLSIDPPSQPPQIN